MSAGTTFTTAMLIADTYQPDLGPVPDNGSVDSIPGFTTVDGIQVSVALELQSTTGGLLIPRMTTDERLALVVANGMEVYDTTLESFMFYENGGWVAIPGVITPTTQYNIAIFNDDDGTLVDSTVRLLASTGGSNLFIGDNAGTVPLRTAANVSTLYGTDIFTNASDSARSTALGSEIGLQATGLITDCTFVGHSIAKFNIDPVVNLTNMTVVGSQACAFIESTSSDSVAMGMATMFNAETALRSVAIGSRAAFARGSYTDSVYIGYEADAVDIYVGGIGIGSSASVGGDYSISLGVNATTNNETSMALGYNAVTNAISSVAIGPGAVCNVTNGIVIGGLGSPVGINTSSPIANLHINGTIAYQAPVIVPAGNFPYTAQANDFMIIGFPTGPQQVILPDASADNLGRAYYISNSAGGVDIINVTTTSGQSVNPGGLFIEKGALYISRFDGVNYSYYGAF